VSGKSSVRAIAPGLASIFLFDSLLINKLYHYLSMKLMVFSRSIISFMDVKNNSYWKDKLTPNQYKVLREKGTEVPYSGKYLKHDKKGIYTCVGCGTELFKSDDKYDSTTPGLLGWPSFASAKDNKSVKLLPDTSFGMKRTEVICAKCGGHLGHIFDDNSVPTGKHYCINSCSLDFSSK
jgi:peptide-methionine (R)-S-oxide reductase